MFVDSNNDESGIACREQQEFALAKVPGCDRQAPSRDANPFATCWTRPGAIPFRFAGEESAAQLVFRLAAHGWWGEIIGPHGSGKSTLLETLKPVLAAVGCNVAAITLRDGERWLPGEFLRGAIGAEASCSDPGHGPSPRPRTLLIIDGYEQLGRLQRWLLKRRCRRAGVGLLITSHAPAGLPPLVCLSPSVELIQCLAAFLCRRAPRSLAPCEVVASHACRGSNVREIFFDLYDRYERLRSAR